jgi:hypothetical protein
MNLCRGGNCKYPGTARPHACSGLFRRMPGRKSSPAEMMNRLLGLRRLLPWARSCGQAGHSLRSLSLFLWHEQSRCGPSRSSGQAPNECGHADSASFRITTTRSRRGTPAGLTATYFLGRSFLLGNANTPSGRSLRVVSSPCFSCRFQGSRHRWSSTAPLTVPSSAAGSNSNWRRHCGPATSTSWTTWRLTRWRAIAAVDADLD